MMGDPCASSAVADRDPAQPQRSIGRCDGSRAYAQLASQRSHRREVVTRPQAAGTQLPLGAGGNLDRGRASQLITYWCIHHYVL